METADTMTVSSIASMIAFFLKPKILIILSSVTLMFFGFADGL